MKTVASLVNNHMIGSRVVRTTFEDINVCSKSNPNRVAVDVDIRGFYSPDQVDELISMLHNAKAIAVEEVQRMNHATLFDTPCNSEVPNVS